MTDYAETIQGQISRISDAKVAIISALQAAGYAIPSDIKINEISNYIASKRTMYTKTITSTDWLQNSSGGYKFTISASTHGVGSYPLVKTYTQTAYSYRWEETYDSPEINTSTGDVTVYSNVNDPLLVIIK